MAAICNIKNIGGIDIAFNDNGTVNQIYTSALSEGYSNKEALNLYLVSEMESYVRIKRDNSLESVIKYAEELSLPTLSLSQEELFDLQSTLNKNNQQLSTYVRTITDPTMRLKVQSFIDQGGVINEALKESVSTYVDEATINTLGEPKTITVAEIEREIIDKIQDFTSIDELNNVVATLPYAEFVQKYFASTLQQQELFNKIKDYQRIPAISIQNNQLVPESRRNTILTNTIQTELPIHEIRAIRRSIENLSNDVWDTNKNDVQKLLFTIEQAYVNVGLDIIGLKDTIVDKASLEVFLSVTEQMLKQPNSENRQMYLDELNAIFPEQTVSEVIKPSPKEKGKTLVYLDTNLDPNQVFDQFRLYKLRGNIYHVIDSTLTENDVVEIFYGRVLNSEELLPDNYRTVDNIRDPLNKPNVLADIRVYLTEYDNSLPKSENPVLVSGVELLMESVQAKLPTFTGVTTDPEYLQTDFVTDFNKYILQEKLKNSTVYREVLSNFYVGNSDIILRNPIPSIANIKYEQELKDYFSLKKDSTVKYLTESSTTPVIEDVRALNYPQTVTALPTENIKEGDFILTNNSPNLYFRQGETLYRKVQEDTNGSLYLKVKKQTNVLYFDTDVNFSTQEQPVKSTFDRLIRMQRLKTSQKVFNLKPPILKSQINVVSLYNESELQNIIDKTEACG